MTTEEIKQQAREEFDERFCENAYCSEEKVIPSFKNGKEVRVKDIKSFIDSLIDKTVQQTEERIVGIARKLQEEGLNVQVEGDYYINFRDLESLITNKSDINNLTE